MSAITELVGKHRTGAASKAVKLSEESRLDITPFSDGTCHLSFIKFQNNVPGGRQRFLTLPFNVIAFGYGYERTVVSRDNDILTITINDNFTTKTHQIGTLTPSFPIFVYNFDPTKDEVSIKGREL